jgi:hypothetical protein
MTQSGPVLKDLKEKSHRAKIYSPMNEAWANWCCIFWEECNEVGFNILETTGRVVEYLPIRL